MPWLISHPYLVEYTSKNRILNSLVLAVKYVAWRKTLCRLPGEVREVSGVDSQAFLVFKKSCLKQTGVNECFCVHDAVRANNDTRSFLNGSCQF